MRYLRALLFLRGGVFALLGYELVEGTLDDGHMQELRSINYGATSVDSNIDHRSVLNLMAYFRRQGKSLPVSYSATDYPPGDIVAWNLTSGIDHIGIVPNMLSDSEDRYLIVHNIGAGTRVEDVLFDWTIKRHYRFF